MSADPADLTVLESVALEPDDLTVLEAGAVMARGTRRSGESLGAFGSRMKGADKAKQDAQERKKKTRGGKDEEFEKKHPRGRGGAWKVKVGGEDVEVEERPDGNLTSKTSKAKIMAFQRRNGLQVDGVIGKQTASALLGNKSASKVKAGKMKADQREKLRPAKKKGRVREAPGDALEELAGVTFKPSELAALK